MLEVLILAIVWAILGVTGFIYWFTKDHDFTSEDIGLAVCTTIVGPLSFLIGWRIHRKNNNGPIVYIKKQTRV